MGVVIVQSKPVAQVYRLFAALVALLLVMAIGFSIAKWRAAHQGGSPYGALTAVATPSVPTIAAPSNTAALAVAPAAESPAPVAAAAPAALVASPAAALPDPVATPPAAPMMSAAAADPAHASARVIALDKTSSGSAPLPAPAAAVAAATVSQAAPPPAPVKVAAVAAGETAASVAPTASAPGKASGLININTASAEMLDHIPGGGRIGKTIARHRPYGSIQDLVDHRVLKAGDLARIRSHITTN